MEMSEELIGEAKEYLGTLAKDLLHDNNRLAKSVAYYVRNGIENFHVKYLSDEQMKELNPLIRNAIYTFLVDFKQEMDEIASNKNIKICIDYVIKNTHPFLLRKGLKKKAMKEFDEAVTKSIDVALRDISQGGLMLAGYGTFYVPKYWEDCEYINNNLWKI